MALTKEQLFKIRLNRLMRLCSRHKKEEKYELGDLVEMAMSCIELVELDGGLSNDNNIRLVQESLYQLAIYTDNFNYQSIYKNLKDLIKRLY